MSDVRFRSIHPVDDAAVAELIRDVMTEFGCTGPGYAIEDPEVDGMAAAYPGGDACFYVVERDGRIEGCGGFAPLRGVPDSERLAELRKMYFRPALRGGGIGSRFLAFLLDGMRAAGFVECYLETISGMDAARAVYRKHGFSELDEPRGSTGHGACDRFFARRL